MLSAVWKKNDRKARIIIFVFSAIVFAAIMALSRVKWNIDSLVQCAFVCKGQCDHQFCRCYSVDCSADCCES